MSDTVRFILSAPDFRRGVEIALPILVAGGVLMMFRHRIPLLPVGGLAVAAAGAYRMAEVGVADESLLMGLMFLAVAGLVRDAWPLGVVLEVMLAAPGAWLVSHALPGVSPDWVVIVVLAVLLIGGPLLSAFDREHLFPPLGPGFLAIGVGAAFLTLPDTEEILFLVPVAAAVALLGWPAGVVRLGAGGSHVALAVFSAVAVWNGRGRHASIIGALATMLLPWVWILLVAASPRVRPTATAAAGATLTGLHVVMALVAARVVGIGDSVTAAAVLTAASVVVLVPTLVGVSRSWSSLPP